MVYNVYQLVCYNGIDRKTVEHFRSRFLKADINSEILKLEEKCFTVRETSVSLLTRIEACLQSELLVILHVGWENIYGTCKYIRMSDVLSLLFESDVHVFLDDCQELLNRGNCKTIDVINIRSQNLTATNLVWIACDATQFNRAFSSFDSETVGSLVRYIPSTNFVTLSLNLRNTSDL